MKKIVCMALLAALPTLLHAQVLKGDDQFSFLNQLRWDMSKEEVLRVCNANKTKIGGSDTTVTLDATLIGAEAKVIMRFKNKGERLEKIEVRFKEQTETLLETVVSHFTRTTGESPVRAEKEKSLLLITMRMEIAGWKTKAEKVILMVGRRNSSIFDMYLSIAPISR